MIPFIWDWGWLMGWINDKQSEGSMISSWVLHGCANTVASIIVNV